MIRDDGECDERPGVGPRRRHTQNYIPDKSQFVKQRYISRIIHYAEGSRRRTCTKFRSGIYNVPHRLIAYFGNFRLCRVRSNVALLYTVPPIGEKTLVFLRVRFTLCNVISLLMLLIRLR